MADIDLCPRCQGPLKFNGAKQCECGWKKRERFDGKREEKQRVFVPCAYDGCSRDALVKILTKSGMTNMCPGHLETYSLATAKKHTAAIGLKTRQDLIDFCRTHEFGKGQMHGEFKRQFQGNKPLRMRERVPGEDDEPVLEHA